MKKIELEGYIILHDEGMHPFSIEISQDTEGRYGKYDDPENLVVLLDEVIAEKLIELSPDLCSGWVYPRCRITIEEIK